MQVELGENLFTPGDRRLNRKTAFLVSDATKFNAPLYGCTKREVEAAPKRAEGILTWRLACRRP
jgi:hypothetical protein